MSELAGLFIGIGWGAIGLSIAYGMYRFVNHVSRTADNTQEKTEAWDTVELATLDKVAEKCGIKVQEFLAKNRIVDTKSFREALEEKMVAEIMSKEDEVKEDG